MVGKQQRRAMVPMQVVWNIAVAHCLFNAPLLAVIGVCTAKESVFYAGAGISVAATLQILVWLGLGND